MTSTTHPASVIAPTRGRYVRAGLLAGVGAAVANVLLTAVTHGSGVSLEVPDGQAIPLWAFAQLTIVAALIGIGMAAVIVRRSVRARHTFVLASTVLTVVSLVPPLLVDADISTKLVLIATHVVAAVIVVPAIASRLPHVPIRTVAA
ncbi:MAG: hypothetical protein JWN99_1885 [Ilumatobacteraceae bacterium]|nr:hypothetical protein [Ilumatobacteraceae bacterium]